MDQDAYVIKTNDKDVTLTVPKDRVATVGDLKKDIASQLNLVNDNMRLFQNKKNFLFGNDVELASVIKDGDQMKAVPQGQKRSMNFGGVSAFQKKPQGVDKQAPTIDMRMKQPFSNEQLPKSDILEELKKFNMPQQLLQRQDPSNPFLANSNPNPNQAESQQPTAPERKPSRADFYKEKGPMGLGGMEGLGGLGDMGALGQMGGMGMGGLSGMGMGGLGGMGMGGGLGGMGALGRMGGLGQLGKGEKEPENPFEEMRNFMQMERGGMEPENPFGGPKENMKNLMGMLSGQAQQGQSHEGGAPPQITQSAFKNMFNEMNPMRQANLSNPMSLFTHMRDNDPMKKMSSFLDSFGMQNNFQADLRSRINQMSDQEKLQYMTHEERHQFIKRKMAEEKQRKQKQKQERIARGQQVQEEKKPTPYKPPEYVYQKYEDKYLNPQQKYKKAVRRLHDLKVPDAEYWATIGLRDEQIAEALYKSKAEYLEPIVHLQMQKHVMKAWFKKIIELDKIKEEKPAFLRDPGVLEYFFGYRLPYPVLPLKLLMQNRREQFVRLIRHWYDVDETEVLSQEEQNKIKGSLEKYTDENLVQKLMKLVESQEQARKLVQICQNDMQAAIKYYLSGQRSLFKCNFFVTFDVQLRQISKLQPWEQQIFLYRWLRKHDNYPFTLRLQCEPHFFQIYCLSMRYLCQPLCNLLIKNKPYIDKLMLKFPPPKQEEERPPKREEEKHYIYVYRL